MTNPRLSTQGSNAKASARLPSLQALRIDDPQVQKAIEAIREWLEVRLGSRGDPYEKAVTVRELEQTLGPLQKAIDAFGIFDGSLGTLSTDTVATLPALRQGAFEQLGDDLYYCNGKAWKKVALV